MCYDMYVCVRVWCLCAVLNVKFRIFPAQVRKGTRRNGVSINISRFSRVLSFACRLESQHVHRVCFNNVEEEPVAVNRMGM